MISGVPDGRAEWRGGGRGGGRGTFPDGRRGGGGRRTKWIVLAAWVAAIAKTRTEVAYLAYGELPPLIPSKDVKAMVLTVPLNGEEDTAQAVVHLLAKHADLTVNGQTAGILPVLVFGAGTDYALLSITTLLPALLALFGRWVFWPKRPHPHTDRRDPHGLGVDRAEGVPRSAADLGRHRGRAGGGRLGRFMVNTGLDFPTSSTTSRTR